jgi:hypothetical protein
VNIRQLETGACYGQMSGPSRRSLHQEVFTFGEHPRKPKIRNAWFPTAKHAGGSVMVRAAISLCSVGPIISLHGRITVRVYVDRLGTQLHPDVIS